MAEPREMFPESTRPPTVEERQFAVSLSRRLVDVSYPAIARTKVITDVPPGRINRRGAMERQRQQEMGLPLTAKPFVRIEHARARKTPIKTAMICDISGSMSRAQLPLGVMRWGITEAVQLLHGSVAVALMGNYGHPIQAPHERVREIEVYEAGGGHENYMDAFRLVDSALDLIDGDGARLLVIITDGHFVLDSAVEYAEVTMDMCRRAGVAVVWMTVSEYFARSDAYGWGAVVSGYGKTPLEMASMLGNTIVDEFKKAVIAKPPVFA